MATIVAISLGLLACWLVVKLPPLHPAQLWTIPWVLATTLFALSLLPYRQMHVLTGLLIIGGTAAFVLGTLAGERVSTRRLGASTNGEQYSEFALAAYLTLGALGLTLMAFLAQIVHEFGVRAALISSPEVRLAIGSGATPVTIKYVYFAVAALALSTFTAVNAPNDRLRRRWLAAAIIADLSMYFATGRSNIILALLIALLIWGVARPQLITPSRVLATLGTVAIVGLVIFTLGGAIIGKTFSANQVSTIDSVFTRHSSLSVLAIPYEYLSAPIAALQRQVELSRTWGGGEGCATVAFVCQILRRAGLNAHPESAVRAATRAPLSWNTYTGLDFWLIDGGLALMAPIAFSFGAFMGALWTVASSRNTPILILYAIFGSTLLFSAYQSNFFAPHIVGSAGIVLTAIFVGRVLLTTKQNATKRRIPGAAQTS